MTKADQRNDKRTKPRIDEKFSLATSIFEALGFGDFSIFAIYVTFDL